jgi:hypothetical protein
MFMLPPPSWTKEVEVQTAKGMTILDLVCFVHKNRVTGLHPGFYAFEVKMPDDHDKARLDRQMQNSLLVAHNTYLVMVDADPAYADKRVGLIRYDLKRDAFTVLRSAEYVEKPPRVAFLSQTIQEEASRFLARLKEEAPAPSFASQEAPG